MAKVEGFSELEAVLKRAPTRAAVALGQAMYLQGRAIIKISNDLYVPIDFGRLKASGITKQPIVTGDSVYVECGYGGAASAYAEQQHEDLSLSHPPKNPRPNGTKKTSRPGRAKFLETAFNDLLPAMPTALAQSCDNIFKGAGL